MVTDDSSRVSRREFLSFLALTPVVATSKWNPVEALRKWWKAGLRTTVGWKTIVKPVVLNDWFAKRMLEIAEKETVFYKLGQKVKFGAGDTVTFTRMETK